MDKKIAVLGTGANGSCVAANLTDAGLDVTLIDQWPEHVETMRAAGLTVQMPDDRLHVDVNAHHLCDVCTFDHKFDYVFLMPKAYDTTWMAHLILPYLADDGLMIGIQNAMTAREIEAIVGPDRTVGCVIELSSEIFTPGLVQRNTPPSGTWLGIGALTPSQEPRLAEVQAILENVGRVSQTADILSAKWMKLVVNAMCLGPVAMLGMKPYEAIHVPGARDLILQAGAEALTVGQRTGYKIEPIFGLGPEDMKDTNRLIEMLLEKIAADIGPAARDCILQDHLKGRYSEADLINGHVAREADKLGDRAPANAAVAAISALIHAGELEPDPANLDLALEYMRT